MISLCYEEKQMEKDFCVMDWSVYFVELDDGCVYLDTSGSHMCLPYGYNRVLIPSYVGLKDIHQIRVYLDDIQILLDYIPKNHMCYRPLSELICGLFATQCKNGTAVNLLCREHCEGLFHTMIYFSFYLIIMIGWVMTK